MSTLMDGTSTSSRPIENKSISQYERPLSQSYYQRVDPNCSADVDAGDRRLHGRKQHHDCHQKSDQQRLQKEQEQKQQLYKNQEQLSNLHELAQLAVAAIHQRCSEQRRYEQAFQTAFHSSHIPQISVLNYVRRIGKYSMCSPECFIISVIFIDRYVAATKCPITFRNIHRLLITATLVSVKLWDDTFFNNVYFASIGGVSNEELNRLEIEFLVTINWSTWVEPRDFFMYCDHLRLHYLTAVESLGNAPTN